MQIKQATSVDLKDVVSGLVPVIIAAFAYPLGNRKMMLITDGKLDAFQRTLGMTLESMPFWIILSLIGVYSVDFPSSGLLIKTLIVALSSGVIATSLFFNPTDLYRKNQRLLASVEATQSGEVIFALIGEILILGSNIPDVYSLTGIGFVILGMILHSLNH